MIKSIKYLLLLAVAFPLVLAGCNDLFDKGDTETTYSGEDLVEFKPTETEIQVVIQNDGSHSAASREIKVQLISRQGVASSDVSVAFSVDGASTAADSLYNLSATSVSIPTESAAASFTITIPADSGLERGDEFRVILNMDEVTGAQPAENLDQATIFIQGVEPKE